MSQDAYRLRPLLIKDHRALVENGQLDRPYRAARDIVAKWMQMEPKAYLYAVEKDGAFLGAVCCFVEPRAPFTARVHLYLNEIASMQIDLWIDALLELVFDEGMLHRLELLIPQEYDHVSTSLKEKGFNEDGRLRDVMPLGKAWQDAKLFSILRHEYSPKAYAFIPFKPSVIVVYGDKDSIYSIDFLQYGETIEASKLFDYAYAAGLLSTSGEVIRAEVNAMDLPKAVNDCVEQIEAYLRGHRTTLDIDVKEKHATHFQKAIWELLREIPYGETRSYMEVALRYIESIEPDLDPNSLRQKARNISRAVGMACGQNPVCIWTPCHRVLGQDRKLTGFTGGVASKAFLLDLEMVNASGEYIVPASSLYRSEA